MRRMADMELSNLESEDSEIRKIDSIIQSMEQVHIRPAGGPGSTDAAVSRLPIIPLEVIQYFATDYFDDEDFIYQEFVLPECILEAVHEYQRDMNGGEQSMEPYHAQVAQYLIMRYMSAHVTDENSPIFPILRRIIFLYESMVHYYALTEEHGSECIDIHNIYEVIQKGTNFEAVLYNTATAIEELIQLNPTSEEYQTIHRYSQETLYGLGLIISQIKLILEAYVEKMGIRVIADGMHQRHIERLFRLTNNMCVIMLFFFLVHEDALENCATDGDDTSMRDDSPYSATMDNGDNGVHTSHWHADNYVQINGENWKIGSRS